MDVPDVQWAEVSEEVLVSVVGIAQCSLVVVSRPATIGQGKEEELSFVYLARIVNVVVYHARDILQRNCVSVECHQCRLQDFL